VTSDRDCFASLERQDRNELIRERHERKDIEMLWFIGAVALAVIAMTTTWGPIGTAAILVTGATWLVFAFRPSEMGKLVANIARRRVE